MPSHASHLDYSMTLGEWCNSTSCGPHRVYEPPIGWSQVCELPIEWNRVCEPSVIWKRFCEAPIKLMRVCELPIVLNLVYEPPIDPNWVYKPPIKINRDYEPPIESNRVYKSPIKLNWIESKREVGHPLDQSESRNCPSNQTRSTSHPSDRIKTRSHLSDRIWSRKPPIYLIELKPGAIYLYRIEPGPEKPPISIWSNRNRSDRNRTWWSTSRAQSEELNRDFEEPPHLILTTTTTTTHTDLTGQKFCHFILLFCVQSKKKRTDSEVSVFVTELSRLWRWCSSSSSSSHCCSSLPHLFLLSPASWLRRTASPSSPRTPSKVTMTVPSVTSASRSMAAPCQELSFPRKRTRMLVKTSVPLISSDLVLVACLPLSWSSAEVCKNLWFLVPLQVLAVDSRFSQLWWLYFRRLTCRC